MSKVNPIMVYLAGPIDDITRDEAQGWRKEISESAPIGVLFYLPTNAYAGTSSVTAPAVDHMNRVAIAQSDGVLANLSGPGRGFGTIREIEFAKTMNKPVVVVQDPMRRLVSLLLHDLHMRDDGVFAGLGQLLVEIQKGRNEQPMMMGFPFVIGTPKEEEPDE
jgi:nucleoside 2-deoxyribosyltransferase